MSDQVNIVAEFQNHLDTCSKAIAKLIKSDKIFNDDKTPAPKPTKKDKKKRHEKRESTKGQPPQHQQHRLKKLKLLTNFIDYFPFVAHFLFFSFQFQSSLRVLSLWVGIHYIFYSIHFWTCFSKPQYALNVLRNFSYSYFIYYYYYFSVSGRNFPMRGDCCNTLSIRLNV